MNPNISITTEQPIFQADFIEEPFLKINGILKIRFSLRSQVFLNPYRLLAKTRLFMKYYIYYLLLGLGIYHCACVSHLYGNDELLDSLEKGIDSWLTQTEVKCDYTYSEGIVSNESIAKTFPESFEQDTLSVHGQFIKSKKMCLISNYVDFDHYTVKQSRNGIYIINENFTADYIPENEIGDPSIIFVDERRPEERNLPCPVARCSIPLNPVLYLSGATNPNPVSGKKKLCKEIPNSNLAVDKIDNQAIKVTLSYIDTNDNQCVSTLSISVKSGIPVPFEGTSEVRYKNGKHYFRKTVASDFIDIGNNRLIPSRISSFQGPLAGVLGTKFEGKWQVRHWKSDNIGKQSPKPDDFIISLFPNTKWGGFSIRTKERLVRSSPNTFDINQLTQGDIYNTVTESVVHNDTYHVRWIMFFTGLFFTLIAAYFLWKRRQITTK